MRCLIFLNQIFMIYEDKEYNEMERLITNYLNELEFICTGVNIKIYDIDVLERL